MQFVGHGPLRRRAADARWPRRSVASAPSPERLRLGVALLVTAGHDERCCCLAGAWCQFCQGCRGDVVIRSLDCWMPALCRLSLKIKWNCYGGWKLGCLIAAFDYSAVLESHSCAHSPLSIPSGASGCKTLARAAFLHSTNAKRGPPRDAL